MRTNLFLSATAIAAFTTIGASVASANLLITYGTNSAGLFSDSGTLLRTYATDLSNPQGITSDAAGNVYIADLNNTRVRMYNGSTGEFIRDVLDATDPTQARSTYGLVSTGTLLATASTLTTGATQLAIHNPSSSNNFTAFNNSVGAGYYDLAYRASDNKIFATLDGYGVQRFDGTTFGYETNVISVAAPTGIALDPSNLYVSTQSGTVTKYDFVKAADPLTAATAQNDAFITGLGYITSVASSPTSLIVADYGTNAVRTYSLAGVNESSFPVSGPASVYYTTVAVPEPTTLGLAGLAVVGLLGRRRRTA
jgi:hypothetical protein